VQRRERRQPFDFGLYFGIDAARRREARTAVDDAVCNGRNRLDAVAREKGVQHNRRVAPLAGKMPTRQQRQRAAFRRKRCQPDGRTSRVDGQDDWLHGSAASTCTIPGCAAMYSSA